MKTFTLLSSILLSLSLTQLNAQDVGITDKSGGITPVNLLQLHKNGSASSTLLQLTNDGTGSTSTDGLQAGIDASQNGFIENLETGKSIFIGPPAAPIATFSANGNVNISGDLTYSFIHGESYAENITYTPTVALNTYVQLQPGLTVSENHGLTYTNNNNNITIITEGDYKIDFVLTLTCSGGSDDYRVKMYKNGAATVGSNHITPGGTGHYAVLSYFWYQSFIPGDVITFYIVNTSNSDNPTISDMKVYIAKNPEL